MPRGKKRPRASVETNDVVSEKVSSDRSSLEQHDLESEEKATKSDEKPLSPSSAKPTSSNGHAKSKPDRKGAAKSKSNRKGAKSKSNRKSQSSSDDAEVTRLRRLQGAIAKQRPNAVAKYLKDASGTYVDLNIPWFAEYNPERLSTVAQALPWETHTQTQDNSKLQRHHSCVLSLLAQEAKTCDWSTFDNTGLTPLHWAVTMDARHCLPILLGQLSGDQLALPCASSSGKHTHSTGRTALHLAVEFDQTHAVDLLLEAAEGRGAADTLVNALDRTLAETALHTAARLNRAALCDTLLAHKADANRIDRMGRTPLHIAARSGHPAVIETILAWRTKGAAVDVNAVNSVMGRTPLDMIASSTASGEIKQKCSALLAEAGATASKVETAKSGRPKRNRSKYKAVTPEEAVAEYNAHHGITTRKTAVKQSWKSAEVQALYMQHSEHENDVTIDTDDHGNGKGNGNGNDGGARKYTYTSKHLRDFEVKGIPKEFHAGLKKQMCDLLNSDKCREAHLAKLQVGKIVDPANPAFSTTPGTGFGLFAAQPIDKFTVVAEYAGEIISRESFDKTIDLDNEADKTNSMDLQLTFKWFVHPKGTSEQHWNALLVDTEEHRGVLSYMNDFRDKDGDKVDGRVMNVEFVEVMMAGWPHVFAIAMRAIESGEEILADYGETWWWNYREITWRQDQLRCKFVPKARFEHTTQQLLTLQQELQALKAENARLSQPSQSSQGSQDSPMAVSQ